MSHAFASSTKSDEASHRRPSTAHAAPPKLEPVGTLSPGMVLQRCACGGGCPACQAKAAGLPPLTINAPDDAYEREADRVADAVMAGGAAAPTMAALPAISQLQRCSCGGSHTGGGKCAACQAAEVRGLAALQRSESTEGGAGVAPPIVHEVLASPGQPLDAGTRAFFEPRFGRSFDDVRVHTGAQAEESAISVNAHAYTVGGKLVFGTGQYRPGTVRGDRLIAHELTHVVQQAGTTGGHSPISPL